MTKTISPTKLAEMTRQIGLLSTLRVSELQERLEQVLGKPVHSHNRPYLIRKLSWHLRLQAEGAELPRTLQELLDAGPAALPDRWRERMARVVVEGAASGSLVPAVDPDRDPRLPPAGTPIVRAYQGRDHCVIVNETDFEYAGRRYRSLSAIARQITGTPWNGVSFFGLARRSTESTP